MGIGGAEAADRAIRLNPNYPLWAGNFYRWAYFMVGRYEDALKVIERQPKEFRIGWDFSWLRGIIEQSDAEALAAHRAFLLGVLDAASKGSREAVLSGLRRLRQRPDVRDGINVNEPTIG